MATSNDEPLAQETTPLLSRSAEAEQLAAARKRGVFPALLCAFVVCKPSSWNSSTMTANMTHVGRLRYHLALLKSRKCFQTPASVCST